MGIIAILLNVYNYYKRKKILNCYGYQVFLGIGMFPEVFYMH